MVYFLYQIYIKDAGESFFFLFFFFLQVYFYINININYLLVEISQTKLYGECGQPVVLIYLYLFIYYV